MTKKDILFLKAKDIITNFDFNKVAMIMDKLDWVWVFDGNIRRVPSAIDIRHQSRQLLKDIIRSKRKSFVIGCGGLEAEKIDNEYLTLRFIAEAYEV